MALLPSRRGREQGFPIASFRDEMDRLFDSFFGPGWGLRTFDWRDLGHFPALDVSETDDAVQVKAEVPGLSADDLDISVSGDTLTIRGEKKEEKEEKGKTLHRVERRYGTFERIVDLPCAIDSAKAKATYRDGVLTIELPKREEEKQKVRKIEVK